MHSRKDAAMKKLLLSFVCLACLRVIAQTNNGAIIYADQYTNLTYQQIVNTVCPSNGCVIYATSPNASLNIGNLDVGSKVVTLYLGPFQYNVTQIILRRGLRVIGMGGTPSPGTILQIGGGSNAIFNLPLTYTASDGTPAGITDVYLYGLRLLGTNNTSNPENGIVLDCRNRNNGGLWQSSFEDLVFYNFHGSAIEMLGPTSNQPYIPKTNQFLKMRNIWATRPDVNASPDLWIDGQNGQIDCIQCHFDGPGGPSSGLTDQWTNVFIGTLSGGGARPYSIHFLDLSTQFAHIGVQIEGAQHLTFIGTHHEDLFGAYQIVNAGGVGTIDVLLLNDSFAGNVGRSNGAGFLVSADNAYNVVLDTPFINGGNVNPPDAIVTGPWSGYVSIRNAYDQYTSPLQFSVFAGDLQVVGTLSKAAGSFKIDHPLDPANKYLSHSFVESPDMMNIYNGIVTLDAHGRAAVILPAYFEALNRDFRYQLTCIGGYAPVYVSQQIKKNQFRISGGKPNLKVSWQVTGIRHDAYANDHRIPVEAAKPPGERGHFLHPELFEKSKLESASGAGSH